MRFVPLSQIEEEEDKPYRFVPLEAEAGGGRGFINPPMAGQPQPTVTYTEPARAPAPIDYGQAATDMMGGAVPAPVARSVLDQPGPVPQTPGYDPMLNQGYVAEVRRDIIGKAAPEDRMGLLTTLAENRTDVLGRAARQILAEVQAENKRINLDQEGRAQRLLDAPRGPGNLPPPRPGAGAAPPPVPVPDVFPGISDVMDGRTAKQIAERRMLAQGVRAADEGMRMDEANRAVNLDRDRTVGEYFGDLGVRLEQGGIMARQVIANTIDPTSQWAAELAQKMKASQEAISAPEQYRAQQFASKLAQQPNEWAKGAVMLAEFVTNPTIAVEEVVRQGPLMGAMIAATVVGGGVGGLVVRGAAAVAPRVALADAISGGMVASAGRAAGAAATARGAAAVAAGGDAAGQVYEELTSKKNAQLMRENADVKRLMEEGKTFEEARSEVALTKARLAQSIAATGGVIFGAAGFEGLLAKKIAGQAVGGTAKRAAVTEITTELADELTTLGASNFAIGQVDPNRALTQDFGQTAATTLVTTSPTAGASAYLASREQGVDPLTDAYARANLSTTNPSEEFISPTQTARSAMDVGPSAPARTDAGLIGSTINFTPPDSITAQAGLAPIVVPTAPAAAGGTDVGLPDVLGGLARGSGVAGGSDPLAGLGGAGRDAAVPGAGGFNAAGALAGDGGAALLGAGATQPGPSLRAGRGERATDADLLARAEQAAGLTEASKPMIWAGRTKTGYANEQDAEQAMATASTVIDTKQTHDWRVEPMGNGRFQIVGYQKGDASGTAVTGAAGQGLAATTGGSGAQQPGVAGAGMVDLGQGGGNPPGLPGGAATVGGAAANEPAFSLKLAPPAPLRAAGQAITMLKNSRGVDVELADTAALTEQQKVASAMARLVGKTVTYMDYVAGPADQMPNGFVIPGKEQNIYLDSKSSDGALFVMMHEGVHALPQPIREKLVTTIKGLTKTDMRADFAQKFQYDINNESEIDNEIAAFMTQAVTKRQDFWQELRTKMGDGDFTEVAKVIIDKLNTFIQGAQSAYGDDFIQRYATDAVAVRDAVSTAYAGAMKAQGQQVPAAVAGNAVTPSNRSRLDLNFKDVVKRTPELQAAAERVKAGEMTAAEYDKLVNETKPVEPYTSVPQPAAETDLRTALTSDKVDRIGAPSKTLKAGDPVGLRLDIPAYSNHGTWVVSVHEQESGYNAGKSIGYEPVAAATNVTFGVVEKAALNIAGGKPKATIAVIKGGWKPTTPAEAKIKADQALKSKEWVQVGMDPERHSYFYDRKTMEPVVKAQEVIQVGPLVLAKNPTYGEKSDFMFSNRVRPTPKASEYDPNVDNYVSPKTAEFLPVDLVERAKGYVSQFRAAAPVQISGADRIKAEGLLRPRLQLAQDAKLDYDQKVLDIAQRTGAIGQKLASVKSIKRAAEKLTIDENFNVDNMKDLLRSTIVVDSYEDAPAVVDEIRKDFEILRVKNRTGIEMQGGDVDNKGFLPSGYGDVLINVRTPNGTLAEIQINVPEMLAAKDEEGHSLYEIERDQPKGSATRDAVIQAQTEYYREAAAAAARRKKASSEGAAERGMAGRSSSSLVASSSLNTLPSGNLTQSSPEKSATNSQPAGNLEGTFIGSPDESSISQYEYSKPPRRGAERVGSFDVRTMKDGSIVVYGDSQNIRSQIPEDVKGRVTKDGYVFTNAAAPRVKAALEGRKTAYSRGGQVTEKLPMKDGKYLGAPEKYNTPGKIVALRKQLRKLTLEGERGRYWYENSSLAILRMTGGNVQEARKFVALLAIYSPQARVDSNSTFALRAWAQYKAGQPISVKTGVQDKKATQAMADVDAFWSGEKTGNFFFNLLREIDTSTAGKQGATIDMWMMRAAEYANDAPTPTQYAFMENETNRIAQEMGWEPQQVQAAIWVAMKARMENKGVKERTEATSEKKGWIRFDYPMKNGRPFKTRVILNAQAHRDNWLKHAMEHVPTKEDTEQAKFDFADGVGRHIGQLSFEARPGRTTGILDGIHDAPYAQQVEFQQAVQRAFYDENGTDMLAAQLGLLTEPSDIMRPGVWQGEVSPSTQKRVAMAPAGGDAGKSNVDPAQAELLNVYASVVGLVARQEGVGWHRPFYAGTKGQSNGLDIDIGRALNPTETKDLEAAIGKWMDDNKHANWQNSIALISSPTGIRVVNFGIITNGALQSEIVKVAEGVLPDGSVRVFASSGDMPTNDWKANPNGQTYIQGIGAAGRSDVLDWARSVLAPRVQRVFEQFAEKYQWGDPGRIQFSNRGGSNAASGGRDRGVGQEDLQGSVTPGYGTPREGAASAVGYHYSKQPRTSLISGMFGTGLRGAEMERLRDADPRLKQRVYFYVDRGTGINPEAGVGGYAHRVNLQNLYDVDEDALRLRRDATGFNAFEAAVIDAGFDGYMVRDAGPSGNAVLLGQHAVPVEQLGSAGRMETDDLVPAARERVLSDAEKIASNKMLPAGQVSGKRWAELISRDMPEVYERLVDNPVWQSDKAMYRSELAKEIRDAAPALTASNRMLPKVSPQSALEVDIARSSANLERAIASLRAGRSIPNKLVVGRLPHVLNMLGARTQEFDIASSIVKKVFVDKHQEDFGGVSVRDFVRAMYRPAMVLKSKDGVAREYELVLPITGEKGAVIVPIKVSVDKDDPLGAVMSAYQKEVSAVNSPKEMTVMKRVNDGNLLYVDPGLAKQAITGRKPGDARDGVKLNENFVSWASVWPKLEKQIADRKVKTDTTLMGWIGDNYKPSSSPDGWQDAPSFSNRVRETPESVAIIVSGRTMRVPDPTGALEKLDAKINRYSELLKCLQ